MKKSRLLEIIREEISAALNEAPTYDINDMEGFKSTLKKFKEEEVSKSKTLNLLLKKLEDEGTVDTNQLSKDMGVDTATFNTKDIRKFLNRPEDESFRDKSGKELIDFTPFLDKSDKPRGRKAGEKPEPKEKEEKKSEPKSKKEEKSKSEPKAKKEEEESDVELAALEKAEKEFYSPEEEETPTEKEPSTKDVKAAEKEFGDVSSDKMEKFNTGLKFIKKYKDDKKIIDAYLKKAKDEYKLPANMIKDLKRAAGRNVEA
jgi:hypothetical protein